MSIKEHYVTPDLSEIRCTANQVLCGSDDPNANSATFGGIDDELIF